MKHLAYITLILAAWICSRWYYIDLDATARSEAFKAGYEQGEASVCDELPPNVKFYHCVDVK